MSLVLRGTWRIGIDLVGFTVEQGLFKGRSCRLLLSAFPLKLVERLFVRLAAELLDAKVGQENGARN